MLSCSLKLVREGHVGRRDAKAGWNILFSLQFCRQSVGHNNNYNNLLQLGCHPVAVVILHIYRI